MAIEKWIQYGSMAAAILMFMIKRKGMKKYIPVGFFASYYANIWCFLAMNFNWWNFPTRIFDKPDDISWPVNFVVVPIMAMFWVRYIPRGLGRQISWAFLLTTLLTGFEYLAERYTGLIKYHNGYDWYYSYILWFFSWFVWYWFYKWLYKNND